MSNLIWTVFTILGGLSIFMYGVQVMSEAVQKGASKSIENFFNVVAANRFLAVFSGIVVTSLIQSSSDVTVMIVSLANAGMIKLTQAMGMIFGANVGTTTTAWIVSLFGFKFSFARYAMPIVATGFGLIFFGKKNRSHNLGEFLFGFGLLFIGLQILKDSAKLGPAQIEFITQWAGYGYASVLIFAIIGFILTVIVHSSSASTAMTIALVAGGQIPMQMAMAIVLGANIGTTIDAFLASLSAGNANAKRVAFTHILFNVVGVAYFLPLFYPIYHVFHHYTHQYDPTIQIAIFHTLFNVTNTLLFMTILKPFSKFLEWLFPDQTVVMSDHKNIYHLNYSPTVVADLPELSLSIAQKEIGHMSEVLERMADKYIKVFNYPDKNMGEVISSIEKDEVLTDLMYVEISKFLVECSQGSLSVEHRVNINFLIRIVKEFESIADGLYHMMFLCQRRYQDNVVYRPEAQTDLNNYFNQAWVLFRLTKNKVYHGMTSSDLELVHTLEHQINTERIRLREQAQYFLQEGNVDVKGEIMFMDHVRHIEQLGDACTNIAEAIRQLKA
jgi:phosphate:Na+ symporter